MFSAALTTDGSVLAGMEDSGYWRIVTIGDPEDLNIIDDFDGVGRKFTSSYAEEKATVEHVLRWLVSNDDEPSCDVLICTEYQSLCNTLLGNDLQPFSAILSTLAKIEAPSICSGHQNTARFQVTKLQTRKRRKPQQIHII